MAAVAKRPPLPRAAQPYRPRQRPLMASQVRAVAPTFPDLSSPTVGFGWEPEALEKMRLFGLEVPAVEAVVRAPKSVELDPSTATRTWTVERRHGDGMMVVMTYPDDSPYPRIWGVYIKE